MRVVWAQQHNHFSCSGNAFELLKNIGLYYRYCAWPFKPFCITKGAYNNNPAQWQRGWSLFAKCRVWVQTVGGSDWNFWLNSTKFICYYDAIMHCNHAYIEVFLLLFKNAIKSCRGCPYTRVNSSRIFTCAFEFYELRFGVKVTCLGCNPTSKSN